MILRPFMWGIGFFGIAFFVAFEFHDYALPIMFIGFCIGAVFGWSLNHWGKPTSNNFKYLKDPMVVAVFLTTTLLLFFGHSFIAGVSKSNSPLILYFSVFFGLLVTCSYQLIRFFTLRMFSMGLMPVPLQKGMLGKSVFMFALVSLMLFGLNELRLAYANTECFDRGGLWHADKHFCEFRNRTVGE